MPAELLHDIRTAARHLFRAPAFTAFAVTLLALGIGTTTAIFSILDALVLSDLPYPEPTRLVAYRSTNATKALSTPALSASDFRDHRQRAKSFTNLAAFRPDFASYTPTGGEPTQFISAMVTEDFFHVFQIAALRGRTFDAGEFRSSTARTAVLSERCWRREFGGRDDAIGRVVTINDQPTTIIGVMPALFREPLFAEVWLPFPADSPEYFARDSRFWSTIARLRPETTPGQAQAEAATIAGALEEEYPATNSGWSVQLQPLREQRVDRATRTALWMLTGAVALVLVVACVNLANILLTRGLRRMPEFAVRLSLGATRAALARTVLWECLLLSVVGGALGAALAAAGLPFFVRQLPDGLIPRTHEIAVHAETLLFAFAVSAVTAALSGLLPALQVARVDVHALLKSAAARTTSSRRATRTQRTLVAVQIALTLVVLGGAAQLTRSFLRLQRVDPGVRADHVLAIRVSPPPARVSWGKAGIYFDRLLDEVRTVPGIVAAGLDASAPFCGASLRYPFWVEGRAHEETNYDEAVFHPVVAPTFDALKMNLREGRWLTDADRENTPAVIVINETLAHRLFPGESPLGRRVRTLPWLQSDWREIVGVVGDVKQENLALDAPAAIYAPQRQSPWFFTTLLIRTQPGGPGAVEIQNALRRADPTLTMTVHRLEENIALAATQARVQTLLFAVFGVVSLALSAFGIYASTSFSVGQRHREIGLRMALGSAPAGILRWVVGEASRAAIVGLSAGLPCALAASSLLRALLFGVERFDAWIFAALVAFVLGVTFVAALVPAFRASRLNPAQALQRD